jgi:mono/diheme cytochrome c family protein
MIRATKRDHAAKANERDQDMWASLNVIPIAVLALAAVPATAAPSDGAAVFAAQCATCHGAEPGDAPAKSDLAKKSPDAVVQALTTGSMQYMAAGLGPDDIRAIAVYLTGKTPSAPAAPSAPHN